MHCRVQPEMSRARLQRVVQQAKATFSRPTSDPCFLSEFEKLKDAVSCISKTDLGVSPSVAENAWDYPPYLKNSSASCMEVYECSEFSVGIFLLKPRATMPLHNHPDMHGIMKVLFGSMSITSYTMLNQQHGNLLHQQQHQPPLKRHKPSPPVPKSPPPPPPPFLFRCTVSSERVLSADRKSADMCCLHPQEGNLHEIVCCEDEPVAFMDILAPPYDPENGRDCTYYIKETSTDPESEENSSAKKSLLLRPSSCPSWFSCVPLPYTGPTV